MIKLVITHFMLDNYSNIMAIDLLEHLGNLVQIQLVVYMHTKLEETHTKLESPIAIGIIIIKFHNFSKQVDKDLRIPILLEILLVNNCLDNSHIIINIIKQVIRVILPSILVKVKYIRTFNLIKI